jgi:hypothetical protein
MHHIQSAIKVEKSPKIQSYNKDYEELQPKTLISSIGA